MEKKILIGIGLVIVLAGAFIFFQNQAKETDISLTDRSGETNWRDSVLVDVNSGEEFKISDFSDKPVLLESFAVWCPTCTQQQREIQELHDSFEGFVSISLDTDPNEDADKVIEYVKRNGFSWRFAVSPTDTTKALISEFGIGFVNAPSAPVALLCPDGTSKNLRSGVKSPDELKSEIESCNG